MKKNNNNKEVNLFQDILQVLGQEQYIKIKKEMGIPLEEYEILFDSMLISPSSTVRRLLSSDRRRNNKSK